MKGVVEKIRKVNLITFIIMNLAGYFKMLFFILLFNYMHFLILGIFVLSELRQIIVLRPNPIKHVISDWKIFMGLLMVVVYALSYLSGGSIDISKS